VEERLEFYDKGIAPRKNVDVMKDAIKLAEEGANKTEDTEMEDAVAETPVVPGTLLNLQFKVLEYV
jgi:hypothetical protein